MEIQKPSLGRIVIYKTTQEERDWMRENKCNDQYELPGVVVAIFAGYQSGDTGKCNVKVFIDGPVNDLWKTSIPRGDAEGEWNWPVINRPAPSLNVDLIQF